MVYWKIDDETIRCLINKNEIGQLGFDLDILKNDTNSMSDFLDTIVKESHKYIEWNTENGVQNYAARALPADQYLITISCTFQDEAINRDIQQMRRMMDAVSRLVPMERLDLVESMTGKEKEEAFHQITKDLRDVYPGKVSLEQKAEEVKQLTKASQDFKVSQDLVESPEKKEEKEQFPNQKITFKSMNEVLAFTSLLDDKYSFASSLYRLRDDYILLVDFSEEDSKVDIITMLITAEEYGGICEAQAYSKFYLKEHGHLLIPENAFSILKKFR